jgi:hypothetical protein
MKKIILVAVILFAAWPAAWAQSAQGRQAPEWAQDVHDGATQVRPRKKTRHVRKVEGTAKWGAQQVSPPPVKKHP